MKAKTKYKDGGKKTTTKKVLTAPKPSFAPKDPFFKQTTSKVGSDTKSTPVKGKPVPAKKKPVVTKPVAKKSTGPTVKSEWEAKTGTPWKEAKERGLTDGSKSQNMRIMKDLKSGEDFKLGSKLRKDTGKMTYEDYQRIKKYSARQNDPEISKSKKLAERQLLENKKYREALEGYKTGGVKKSTTRKKK